MNDTSDRISALKIDRSTATPSGGGFRWSLLVPAVLIVIVLGWWFVLRPGAGAVLVETDIARRPPSAAAASSKRNPRSTLEQESRRHLQAIDLGLGAVRTPLVIGF